ncbi:MAG: helix-turn-helix domain-containing protein [Armatimonadetes bacterium]|nr:helix-turn-helix domain-containing protein [Armatimonadota bacterium]
MQQKSLFHEVELYDLSEIATMTSLSVQTLRIYIKQGRLRAHRFGRKWKATREQVLAFLNGDEGPPVVQHIVPQPRPMITQPQVARSFAETPLPAPKVVEATFAQEAVETDRQAPSELIDGDSQTQLVRAVLGELEERADDSNGGVVGGQLLFMKPQDLDKLVQSLAVHTDRLEERAAKREEEMHHLVEALTLENERLREELTRLREDQEKRLKDLAEEIGAQINSEEKRDIDRFRFTWIQSRLEQLSSAVAASEQPAPSQDRPWWKMW